VPAALRARLAPYLEVRQAFVASIADDASALLVATRFGQTVQTHLVRTPLGARTQLTFGPEPARGGSFVPPDARALLYLADRGGDEQYQIHRLELAGGAPVVLTDGRSRHPGFSIARDGSRIAYASNARNGKDMDIYLGDGRSAAAGALALERQGDWSPRGFSRDGAQLLLSENVSINDTRLYVMDVATKAVRRVTPAEPAAAYRAAVFDASGRRLFVTSDREGEHVELYEHDLASGGWRSLSRHIPWSVEDIALSHDGRTVAFVVNENGWGVLRLLDTASGREKPAPKLARGVVAGLACARRAPVLAFTLFGPTEPGDAHTYDLGTGKLTRWTASELAGLDRARFVEPQSVEYASFDGRRIPALYYQPAGPGPHPVVISIHGGPEAQARPYFSAIDQFLAAESGIAVLVPNVRGSDGYGKSYLLLDNGMRREDAVKDIGALLDWIATRAELDRARVAVTGGSYGGYMVLASLAHYPERIAAGIDIVGISNFVTFLENTMPYRRDLRRVEYGDERDPAMRAFLEKISPTTNAARIRSALFVAHGANDPRVPLGETDRIVAAVRAAGRDVWYMVAMNEGHGFQKRDNRDRFFELSILFLEKHLRAGPGAR
jgi:dipeptidyl aminopeptidase/acylaminoacyl peptidase